MVRLYYLIQWTYSNLYHLLLECSIKCSISNMHLSTIEFGSLLSYSPRGTSDSEKESKTYMNSLKHDEFISDPPILMSEFVSKILKEDLTTLSFSYFFKLNPILVPIPNSSLIRPGTLWVPQRLASALIKQGLGSSV